MSVENVDLRTLLGVKRESRCNDEDSYMVQGCTHTDNKDSGESRGNYIKGYKMVLV